MDKLHKYAKKYCDGDIVISKLGNSYYYHFNKGKFILRISDHIGKNSDGNISIIIEDGRYILYNHTTGITTLETYNSIKILVKSLAILSYHNIKFDMVSNKEMGKLKQSNHNMSQQINSLKNKNKKLGEKNVKINNEMTSYRNQANSYKHKLELLENKK